MTDHKKLLRQQKRNAQILRDAGDYVRADKLDRCGILWADSPEGNYQNISRCRDRLCVGCSKSKEWQRFFQMDRFLGELDLSNLRFWFVTISPNTVHVLDLHDRFEELRTAWKRIKRHRGFRDNFIGYTVSVENHYSGHHNESLHPHLHMILASNVDASTIEHADQINDLFVPVFGTVQIKTVGVSSEDVSAVFRYTVKGYNYFKNKRLVTAVSSFLFGKRLLWSGGIFKGWSS